MALNLKYIFIILLIILGYYFFLSEYNKIDNINIEYNKSFKTEKLSDKKINNINEERVLENNKITNEENFKTKLIKNEIILSKGDSFFSILKKFDLPNGEIYKIVRKIEEIFDLKKLKINDKIFIYKSKKDEIKQIEFNLDIDTVLVVNLNDNIDVNVIELKKLSYQTSKEFKILESLYTDGIKNELPQPILIELIKLFSFDLDFQRDIKKNTLVSISYDFEIIESNNNVKYNDINYALISIEGKKIEYFKFITDDGYIDYFNKEGKNVKKSILKTPLDGARLSSNFGMRKHPISGFNKMHKGVDFAAPSGTPVYAGGNGIIEYLGRNGGYGKYIRIRHNNEYKTAYAHLSGYKKGISKGTRVNQGDIIGYVGSTGNSTGPHLHYEILYQNKHVNPLKLKLPSGKILTGQELKRFKREFKVIYADHLNLLYE